MSGTQVTSSMAGQAPDFRVIKLVPVPGGARIAGEGGKRKQIHNLLTFLYATE